MQLFYPFILLLLILETPASLTESSINNSSKVRPSGLEMIPVEGGTYTMGEDTLSDECPHKVTVGDFSIGKYEITQTDWKEIMGDNPSFFTPCNDCPVENVTWDEVQEFIKKLNIKFDAKYRLPTEEEWEYAALGGVKSKNFVYAGNANPDQVAWYVEISKKHTHTVGTLKPNELGIFNMSGNVIEWCSNDYKPYPCEVNGKKPEGKVLRGGAWSSNVLSVRIKDRNVRPANFKMNNIGFRLAK